MRTRRANSQIPVFDQEAADADFMISAPDRSAADSS
jgi:hypothetical protein